VIINKRQSSFQIRSAFVLLKGVFIAKCRLVSFRAPFRLQWIFQTSSHPHPKQTFTNRHTRTKKKTKNNNNKMRVEKHQQR
jgi:hypothetical protein